MKLYTKGGDTGQTGLFGGARVPKDHDRVEAYGEVDELGAALGLAREASEPALRQRIAGIQARLFDLGAALANPKGSPGAVRPEDSAELERWIDEASAELPEQRHFNLCGGGEASARLHLARTVCRRAERRVVRLAGQVALEPELVIYLNRLSDLLFAWARLSAFRAGAEETIWTPRLK